MEALNLILDETPNKCRQIESLCFVLYILKIRIPRILLPSLIFAQANTAKPHLKSALEKSQIPQVVK